MHEIRIVTDFSEKQKTRPLYEQAFEDPQTFVDYYYREKCLDNTMVVKYGDEGEVLSMLHLNPYTVSVCGVPVSSYYVVAVATDEKHRRKGHMAEVLRRTFAFLEEAAVPFVFLLPVDEAIYTPFGFETVCDFIRREHPLYALPYEKVREQYDVYCLRDARYLKRQDEEDALAEEGAGEVLPDDPVMMMRVTHAAALSSLLHCPAHTPDRDLIRAIRRLRIYFREEV